MAREKNKERVGIYHQNNNNRPFTWLEALISVPSVIAVPYLSYYLSKACFPIPKLNAALIGISCIRTAFWLRNSAPNRFAICFGFSMFCFGISQVAASVAIAMEEYIPEMNSVVSVPVSNTIMLVAISALLELKYIT